MPLNTDIFTDKVQRMQPYHVPNSGALIKLDAMESPYPLPDEMRQALGTALSLANINRYPNPHSSSLVAKIKSSFALPEGCDILLGNGSDELIQLILMATMHPNATVLAPAPSFVMYQQTAEILGMNYVSVDLNPDFSIDEAAFLAAIEKHQPAVIFLAYPNNPTGNLVDKAFVERILAAATGLVVLDEAYTAYADNSVAQLIAQYDQAILIRTLSKIGFAGLRLGYLAANPAVVAQIEKVRMPYNINVLTQAATRFMLDQMAHINHNVDKLLSEKTALYDWLNARDDVQVFPSQTNFLLLRCDNANDVFTRLRDEYRILVKNLHGTHPVLDNVLRITIGRKKENTQLREALDVILQHHSDHLA